MTLTPPRPEDNGHRTHEGRYYRWGTPLAVSALLISIVSAIFTGSNVYLLSQANNITRQNNIISERALVSVDYNIGATQAADAKDGSPIVVIQIPLINSGNTATKNFQLFVRCAPSADSLPEPWVLLYRGPVERIPQMLAPHQTGRVYCSFPLPQIQEVQRGKLHAYVMGNLTYRDRLDDSVLHRTQFDWELFDIVFTEAKILPNTQIVLVPPGVIMHAQPRGRHNCTDEECPANHGANRQRKSEFARVGLPEHGYTPTTGGQSSTG
jgi:hypothetical protein